MSLYLAQKRKNSGVASVEVMISLLIRGEVKAKKYNSRLATNAQKSNKTKDARAR